MMAGSVFDARALRRSAFLSDIQVSSWCAFSGAAGRFSRTRRTSAPLNADGTGPGTAAIPEFLDASAPHRREIPLRQDPVVVVRRELPPENAPYASLLLRVRQPNGLSLPQLRQLLISADVTRFRAQKPLARIQPFPDWCLQLRFCNNL